MVFTTPENDLADGGFDFDGHNTGAGRKGRLLRLAGLIDLDNAVSASALFTNIGLTNIW